jgi:carbamoyl-phosphate synthase large subunit
MVVIEMNPRVSRSSALASKATGFPIAKIAAKLALGYHLDEIPNDITRSRRLLRADHRLRRRQDSAVELREVPAGRSHADDADEVGRRGDGDRPHLQRSVHEGCASLELGRSGLLFAPRAWTTRTMRALRKRLACRATADVGSVPRIDRGWTVEQLHERRRSIRGSSQFGKSPRSAPCDAGARVWDVRAAAAEAAAWRQTRAARTPRRRCASAASRNSSRSTSASTRRRRIRIVTAVSLQLVRADVRIESNGRKKVVILGSGPNRIGQGIEFDYCCCHAAFALREEGLETVMINCNPETVSTDYDTADRLYFQPLTFEDVMAVIETERSAGGEVSCLVQFGGQTPLKLALALQHAGVPILGTSPDSIDLAEDRKRFAALLSSLDITQPASGTATSRQEARDAAASIGFPVVVRPSYVLGGPRDGDRVRRRHAPIAT